MLRVPRPEDLPLGDASLLARLEPVRGVGQLDVYAPPPARREPHTIRGGGGTWLITFRVAGPKHPPKRLSGDTRLSRYW